MFEKSKLIIVEGAQGVGKTSITNLLREKIPCSSLLRLSGVADTTELGKERIKKIFDNTYNMIMLNGTYGMNYILDRSHLSEAVYCRLGYKQYNFIQEEKYLDIQLSILANFYEITIVLLTATKEDFTKRLKRDKATYANIFFSVDNSLKQQKVYIEKIRGLSESFYNINCLTVPTSKKTLEEVVSIILNNI